MNRYGNDIILKDGDFVTTNNGDLFTCSDYEKTVTTEESQPKFEGYYNVLFSLTDRLLTLKGDNIFHEQYGSDLYNLLSRPNSNDLSQSLRNSISECLLKDDRVKEISSIVVEQKDNKVFISADIVLIGSDEISRFVFPSFIVS